MRCGYAGDAVVDRMFANSRPQNIDGDPADKLEAAE